jgi:hypothetical protein
MKIKIFCRCSLFPSWCSVVENFGLNFVPGAAVMLRRQFSMFGYLSYFYFSIFEFILIVVS